MTVRDPIFIHSLFRSGSTYFFHEFRKLGPEFTCYYEPFNEDLVQLNDRGRHQGLLEYPTRSAAIMLRHPLMDQAYFYEYWTIRDRLQGLFHRSFSYSRYFPDSSGHLPKEQLAYVSALIENSCGRPVLGLCRSSGRVGALKEAFGGLHLDLWREPRIQWWSYKTDPYFDRVSQKIYQSRDLPRSLREIRNLAGILRRKERYLGSRESYLIFYGLWLDARLRFRLHTDLSINLDTAGTLHNERDRISAQLATRVGRVLDLSNLHAPGMAFDPSEDVFYTDIESTVHETFLRAGAATSGDIEEAGEAARIARQVHRTVEQDCGAQARLRRAAIATIDELAKTSVSRSKRFVRACARGLRMAAASIGASNGQWQERSAAREIRKSMD